MEYFIIGFAIAVACIVIILCIGICYTANRTINSLAEMDREERESKKRSIEAFIRSSNLSIIEEIAMQPYSDITWEQYMEINRMSNEDFDVWYENYWKTDGN